MSNVMNILAGKCVGMKVSAASKKAEGCDHEEMQEMTPDFALDVYREHLSRRQIIISGIIDATMVEKVTLQIARFNEQDDMRQETEVGYNRMGNPVYLKIASPGGYVDYGMGIVSQIMQSRTPVISVAIGDISSMASIIFCCSHARISSVYSRIMLHSLASGFGGKLFDKIDDVEESKKIQQILDDIIVKKTLITQKMLDKVHETRKDWYMSADEAKALGLVDEVGVEGIKLIPIRRRAKK